MAMKNTDKTMEKIVSLCKGRGFVYPGSDIYGGLANSWDYGPLGVELKNNVKRAWWKKFITESKYNVGIDAAILMNPEVWVASGHVGGFSDPLMDCKECKARFRADKLIEDAAGISADGWSNEKMLEYISQLSNADQERMQSVLSQLYRQTFLLERKYDKRAGRLVLNQDYYFCEQHMEFLKDYLDVAGIFIDRNTELGAIYIQGQTLLGERLPKLATIYLLLRKLIYDEQMAAASSSVSVRLRRIFSFISAAASL